MLLSMAVVAATTHKVLERQCAVCGAKAIFPPTQVRNTVHCPQCDAPIPPPERRNQ